MKKILLDTNAYSNLLKGDKLVLDWLAKADIVYMSIFVLGELYAGFKGGTKEVENKEYLSRFLSQSTVHVLPASQETAIIFADLKHQLRIEGTPIPITDVWIASHAVEEGAVMITYDQHFNRMAGLRLWDQLN